MLHLVPQKFAQIGPSPGGAIHATALRFGNNLMIRTIGHVFTTRPVERTNIVN